jgi:ligand-binding sensor domain-containing protein
MVRGFLLSVLLILMGQAIARCQHPVYRQITTDEGLPSDEVYSIIKDENGLIWIGCDAGFL